MYFEKKDWLQDQFDVNVGEMERDFSAIWNINTYYGPFIKFLQGKI